MRAMVTGQVGIDKGPYLEQVKAEAKRNGIDVEVCHIGKMMYEEAPDVPKGRILNLPISRLNTLRRAVFKEVLQIAEKHEHVIINTHATFRWRHGLFAAFDYDQMKQFDADIYISLMDNAESVHHRLAMDHDIDHTLKDIMMWREEETLATEMLGNILKPNGNFFIVSRGRENLTWATMYRLIFERDKRMKVYPSFPMSHVMDLPDTLKQIDAFRAVLAEHFITFDPGDVDEYVLHLRATKAKEEGKDEVEIETAMGKVMFKTDEILQISGDIMGQIYARDFKMVDQSDIIVSLVPELPNGKPALSSGVERELHHAFEGGKEVYVVWACRGYPSPFITETATKVFRSLDEALVHFQAKGYIKPKK
jgi:adenylate kinase